MESKDRVREFSQSGKLFLIVRPGNSSLGSAFALGRYQLQLFRFKPPTDCTSSGTRTFPLVLEIYQYQDEGSNKNPQKLKHVQLLGGKICEGKV